MRLATALTERLGITRPVPAAPMAEVAGGALAAAGSRAGGLGVPGGGYGEAEWLHRELGLLEGTRFGVGFITRSPARRPELPEIALAAGPTAVMLSFGDIRPFVEPVRAAGAAPIRQVRRVREAREVRPAAEIVDIMVAGAAALLAGAAGFLRPAPPLSEDARDVARGARRP